MTTALYQQIFKNPTYREKLKSVFDFDDVIDHFISKCIISEVEYGMIWNNEGNKLDPLFDHLSAKKFSILKECSEILKYLYGSEFEKILNEIREDILDNIHLKGGFPKINKYIPRNIEEAKVKEKFAGIRWNKSLVVYGRVGEGKSYLVCECLKDIDLIQQYFNNHLYWINVGECENGNIIQPLKRLLEMVRRKKIKIYDVDDIIRKLQCLFSSQKHKKSLVILDNARSLEVIEVFQNLRCKLIIITYFKRVEHAEFVEVNSGFTLNETVNLFSQYLQTTIQHLNMSYLDDIKDLCELCKGHPSTLALLAVILGCRRDHALASKDFWEYIKDKIEKGKIEDLGNNDVDVIQQNFYKALKMCIDTIKTDEMKELYYHFAVFPKDANISTEVLEVFWEKKTQEVCNIMLHFENRSLINSFYNIKKKAYIYVIHDLFLYYLKKETADRKKEFHRKLITSYEKRYEFYELPDDNYILLFLGYHLKQAEMVEKFQNFLDLRFIEHKILLVGVNNMEQDLKIYGDEIINGNIHLKKKLESCIRFLKDNKNELLQLQKTDIIQLALPTLKDDAQNLMVKNQANSINKLYFTTKLSAGRLKSSQESFLPEEVTAMAFCQDSNVSKVLIGLQNGDILLYCQQTNREFDRFQGHKRSVFDLKVSHDNSSFLSVSNDRTVKLWHFFPHGINSVVSSPKCVQTGYFDAFNIKKNNFKEFVFNEDKAYLISANFSNQYKEIKKICTGTNNGKVIIWNSNREKLCCTTETGFPVENVYFSHDDSKILFTKQEKVQIYRNENDTLIYDSSICNLEDIIKIFVPNENTVVVVGSRHIMMYQLPYEEESSQCIQIYESNDYEITCSAVANDAYVAISVNEKVLLFDVSNGALVETLIHNKKVTSISMDISKDDDNVTSMILMNFDGNNIQQCNIMMKHYNQPRNKQSLVSTYWKNNTLPMLALVLNDNILRIQHEFTTLNEVEKPHRISFITFSLCGNSIIFSIDTGVIMEYQYKRQNCFKTLMELHSSVKYLECLQLELPLSSNCFNSLESNNGAIVAITDKKIHTLINGNLRNFSWEFPIFQVFPIYLQQLLCIDESEGVFIIDLSRNENNIKLVTYGKWNRKVTSTALCERNDLVAAAFFTTEVPRTFHLEIINVKKMETLKSIHTNFLANICAFSYLGSLLVLGGEDGRIMVYNVQNNFKCNGLSNTGVPVKFMQFSMSTLPILVAVGKEVSWWNLQNFEHGTTSEKYTQFNSDFDLSFWENKTVHDEIPNLLQTVNLYSNAVHFSVSKNFETFLVVDDESRIYKMKCFKNVQYD